MHRNNFPALIQPRQIFSSFPKYKTNLKGHQHLDAVKTACTQPLKNISVINFEGAYAV